ncbi:MAG TPA: hypothetical protein V6C72_07935 [Chroococcales cyanobacterium]
MDPINTCLVLIYDSAYSRESLSGSSGNASKSAYERHMDRRVNSLLSFGDGDPRERMPIEIGDD